MRQIIHNFSKKLMSKDVKFFCKLIVIPEGLNRPLFKAKTTLLWSLIHNFFVFLKDVHSSEKFKNHRNSYFF